MKREGDKHLQTLSTIRSQLSIRTIWLPVLLGLSFSAGECAARIGYIPLTSAFFYAKCIVYCIVFTALFTLSASVVEQISINDSRRVHTRRLSHFPLTSKNLFSANTKIACSLFLCWLPYIVLLYPGVLYWDTGDQLAQFFGIPAFGQPAGMIWDHHPFFDTFIYGFFANIGKTFFNSIDIGIFFYVIVQLIVAAYTFSLLINYLKYRGIGQKTHRFMYAFFAFFPVIPIMLCAVSKDITHSIIFLQWCILYSIIISSNFSTLKKPSFVALFLLITLLASLTKKTGMYIILFAMILLLFKKSPLSYKIKITGIMTSVFLVVSIIIPKVLFPTFNIVPGGPQTTLVVPIQQVARVAYYYPNDVTEEERDAIDGFLLTGWSVMSENYNPYIADPVTAYNVKNKDRMNDFLKAWITIGLRHPLTYVNAFVAMESGWTSFTGSPVLELQTHDQKDIPLQIRPLYTTSTNPDTYGRLSANKQPGNRAQLVDGLYSTLLSAPIINSVFYIATWTSILPCFALFLFVRSKINSCRKSLIVTNPLEYAPYIISALSLVIYAVSLSLPYAHSDPTRYMFHCILLAPLYFGLLLSRGKNHALDCYKPDNPCES